MKLNRILQHLTVFTSLLAGVGQGAEVFDVVVYGGTPGGITAAISAAREGSSVVLLEQTKHVGGLSTSGLNRDELEHMDRLTMGGLSENFLNEAARRSATTPKPAGYITPGPRVWQSHIAEKVFLEMLEAAKVPVRYEQLLQGVSKEAGKLTALTVRGGTSYQAKVFIDATYEGDLMAAAGISYALGREARDTYGESLGGVRYLDEKIKGSPYDEEGKLLPGIMPGPPPPEFSASPHPICYNIRLNLSKRAENSVPIEKPATYDPKQYELMGRSLSSGWLKKPGQVLGFYGMPGGKMECNNSQFSIISMSMPGEQTAWAEASFEEREAIHKKYREYTHGLLWFLKSDPRVPQHIREEMAGYGLCKDEWADNGHWPYYLYIRAARRMKGEYIVTQDDITTRRDKADVVHIGSHFIDSHHVARYAVDKDHFINEGRIWEEGKNFDIPYRAITPRKEECRNLLVPVCVSSSAVAFCAIRLEPTWMHLGEVSGMAASLAIRDATGVQDINVKELQGKITKAGIPLEVPDNDQALMEHTEAPALDQARESARIASFTLSKVQRWLHEVALKQIDPGSNLYISSPIGSARYREALWNYDDAAADTYPFLFWAAWVTDRDKINGPILDVLKAEQRICNHLDRIPTAVNHRTMEKVVKSKDDTIFGASEYLKDGLVAIVEVAGKDNPWFQRMRDIQDDIWKHADIDTPYGKIPTLNLEANGDQLQVLVRLFTMTGERKYLEWAERLADYYLLGGKFVPDHLRDHGCEIIGGLGLLFGVESVHSPEKAKVYEPHIRRMLDEILKRGVNEDGIMFNRMVSGKSGGNGGGLNDSWGYNYVSYLCYDMATGSPVYRERVQTTLANLAKPQYRSYPWERNSIDGFADSVEGGLYLINRLPVSPAIAWADAEVEKNIVCADKPEHMWSTDKLNSNAIRTALIHAMMHTRGVTARPWRQGLTLGAAPSGGGLTMVMSSPETWSGSLEFDVPRHRLLMGFNKDWPRMNTMPEWFTVEPEQEYVVYQSDRDKPGVHKGTDLQRGLKLTLIPGQEVRLRVQHR